jgi:hypothetical protein
MGFCAVTVKGAMEMAEADVKFARSSSGVRMTLAVDGAFVFEGSDVTQMVREMAMRGVTELRLTNTYSVKVPTNCDTLTDAAKQRLDEPLAAFILISACA